jgi:translation initiation factor IF-2
MTKKPPVVAVLGHVDHGKSSILEAIKDLRITRRESGGITQHIGAYEVEQNNQKITFIDTPGHEAFSAMRSRGAQAADIALLVIAADDGIKPQTKEAAEHIKKAGIPFIVVINKIDKPEANPEKVRRSLMEIEILVESLGGQIPSVEVSAITKQGINDLLEIILLLAEMEELEAEETGPAKGVVVESRLTSHQGPTATLLVKEGCLKIGDVISLNSTCGKIKGMEDFHGDKITKTNLSQPVVVFGLNNVPRVGDNFQVATSLEEANSLIKPKENKLEKECLAEKMFPVIIKADVLGSLEALEEVVSELGGKNMAPQIISSGVGEISENDVHLASSSCSIILAFRVKTSTTVKNLAERENVRIFTFDIIYALIEALHKLMEQSIKPSKVRIETGAFEVLAIFRTEKNRQILGGKVLRGELTQGSKVQVKREEDSFMGKINNLQRNKKEVGKVKEGDECGLLYEGERVVIGDLLTSFRDEEEEIIL